MEPIYHFESLQVTNISKKWGDDMDTHTNKTASDILRECGQKNVPIDLKAILDKLNISAIGIDFSTIENSPEMKGEVEQHGRILGAIIRTGEKTAIFYSNQEYDMTNHRYRFTIAHELGHYCQGYCQGDTSHIEFRHDKNLGESDEIQANIFAGEL